MIEKKKRSIIGHPRASQWFLLTVLLGQVSTSVIQLAGTLYTSLINLTGNENLFWGFPFFEWSHSIVTIMDIKGILVSEITTVLLCLLLAILIYQIKSQINASLTLTSLLILGLPDITLTTIALFNNLGANVIAVAALLNSQITFILMVVYLSQILIGVWGIWLFRRSFLTEVTFNQTPFSKHHLYLVVNLWGLILSNYLEHSLSSGPEPNIFFFITIIFRFTFIVAILINLKPVQPTLHRGYLMLLLILIIGLPLRRYHLQFSNVLIIITLAQYLIKSRQISSNEKATNS